MFCHKCGTQLSEGAAFCHNCGTKVVYENDIPTDNTSPELVIEAEGVRQTETSEQGLSRIRSCKRTRTM